MKAPWPDERFRRLTAELLASLSADEVPEAIVQHVHLRIGKDTEREPEIVRSLPSGVMAVYTTWLVDAEVNNGGFNQYFFNPAGQFAGDALAGYELLGAEPYAAVMRSAIATFEADRDRLAPFYELHTPEALKESYKHTDLGEADQRYYALGDQVRNIWADAVRSRPELFVGGEFRPGNRLRP
jgi:Domain of unknown function (DUF4375)